jgi:cyclitol reductase
VNTETSIRYRVYRHSGGSVRIANEVLSNSRLTGRHEEVVLIQPTFVGICSADVRELRGERRGKCDFGHEIVGTVLESNHAGYPTGQCVALNPFVKVARETAFAELMYVAGSRDLLDSALLRVPADNMEFSAVEPLACVIHAVRQSQLMDSGPKLVFGAGFFGYLLYCYLEFKGIPVMLGNRTRDRLDHLRKSVEEKGVGRIFFAPEVKRYAGNYSTVFLTQARLSQEDVASAVNLVHDHGEIILFGAIDPADSALYATRNQQQRRRCAQESKSYFLQGTLDASPEDLHESVETLSLPSFAHKIAAIFAPPLTFEEGAAHLTERARSPRSYEKYVVGLNTH